MFGCIAIGDVGASDRQLVIRGPVVGILVVRGQLIPLC